MIEQRSWGEECGVFAAVGVPRAAEVVRLGLHALQHRGQESSGIVSCDPQGELHSHRGLGLVSDLYGEADMLRLPGQLAIGHNRYSTSGSVTVENTQRCAWCIARALWRWPTTAIWSTPELRQGLRERARSSRPRSIPRSFSI
jgi:glutamine phosphoribosylpyrophosphate amidotransferase